LGQLWGKLHNTQARGLKSKTLRKIKLAPVYTAKSCDETATTFLNGIGVRVYSKNQEIFTATVSPYTVKELSQQP
jgi:hypothetical protein